MQTLSTALTLAQKQPSLDALYKIVLTLGANTYTYGRSQILSITRTIQDFSDSADVLLDNADGELTDLDLTGYQGIISKGLVLPDNSEQYSATAPLFVIPQQFHSLEYGNFCRLSLAGIFNLMTLDEASDNFEILSDDTRTIKDLLTEIITLEDSGGSGGERTIEQTSVDSEQKLYNGWVYYAGQKLTLLNQTITKLSFYLKKVGSPTGNITFYIYDEIDNVIGSTIWGNASSLTTSFGWKEATFDPAVVILETKTYRMAIEFTGGDVNNYIVFAYKNGNVVGGCYTHHNGGVWTDEELQDAGYIYTYDKASEPINVFAHCKAYDVVFGDKDDIIDSFVPADFFSVSKGDNRKELIKTLLAWTNCVAIIKNDGGVGKVNIFKPTISGDTWVANTAYVVNDYVQPTTPNNNFTYRCTTAGTSHATEPTWPTTAGGTVADNTVVWTAVAFDYEYELTEEARTAHTIFAKTLRKRLPMPNRIVVQSDPSHADQYLGEATISGYASLDDDVKKTHFAPYLRLTGETPPVSAQATAIAKALLAKQLMDSEEGSGNVPMNVGAELYDYVKITDAREGNLVIGNMGYIKETCKPDNDASKGFFMTFSLGKLMEMNAIGLTPTDAAFAGGIGAATSISALNDTLNIVGGSLLQLWKSHNRALRTIITLKYAGIPFIIHGGGSEITDDWKGNIIAPFPCEIMGVILDADQVGDIVIDIWKDVAGSVPTVADTICAAAKPTLTNGVYYADFTLAGWTKTVSYLDIISFVVDSCTTITQLTVVLVVRRT